jgi:hypothetical protein
MYNVTLRCVRATIVAVEQKYVLHILSVFEALESGIQSACAILPCNLSGSMTFFHIFH